MRSTVLERVGYFHFVSREDPIKTLTDEIKKAKAHQDIHNSLIVLPEAFNQAHYDRGEPVIDACKTRDELRKLAALYSLAFVAGILDGRCNTAYWIDAGGSQLVCHKMGDDGYKSYDTCTENYDEQNPIDCTSARIGALICMDAVAPALAVRREVLLHKVRSRTSTRIICVPARFKSSERTKPPEDFQGCWYVVANGSWRGHESSITDPSGNEIEASTGEPLNEIKLARLTSTL